MITQEKFDELMQNYLESLALEDPSTWSEDARQWCESTGLIEGDGEGHMMYKKFLTREEIASILYKLHNKNMI